MEEVFFLGSLVVSGGGFLEDRRWYYLGSEAHGDGTYRICFSFQRSEGVGYTEDHITQTVRIGSVIRLADGFRMTSMGKKAAVDQLTVLEVEQDMIRLRGEKLR